jgi:hypothetical protein
MAPSIRTSGRPRTSPRPPPAATDARARPRARRASDARRGAQSGEPRAQRGPRARCFAPPGTDSRAPLPTAARSRHRPSPTDDGLSPGVSERASIASCEHGANDTRRALGHVDARRPRG